MGRRAAASRRRGAEEVRRRQQAATLRQREAADWRRQVVAACRRPVAAAQRRREAARGGGPAPADGGPPEASGGGPVATKGGRSGAAAHGGLAAAGGGDPAPSSCSPGGRDPWPRWGGASGSGLPQMPRGLPPPPAPVETPKATLDTLRLHFAAEQIYDSVDALARALQTQLFTLPWRRRDPALKPSPVSSGPQPGHRARSPTPAMPGCAPRRSLSSSSIPSPHRQHGAPPRIAPLRRHHDRLGGAGFFQHSTAGHASSVLFARKPDGRGASATGASTPSRSLSWSRIDAILDETPAPAGSPSSISLRATIRCDCGRPTGGRPASAPGQFERKVMPFGMQGASSVLMRVMNAALTRASNR